MADSSSYFLISCSSSFFFISLFLLSSYLFFVISILFHIFFSSFLHIIVSSLLPNLFYIHWCVCAYSFYLYDLLASDWFIYILWCPLCILSNITLTTFIFSHLHFHSFFCLHHIRVSDIYSCIFCLLPVPVLKICGQMETGIGARRLSNTKNL